MSKFILPTYTGIMFDLLEPTIDMICIEDIAHHTALINRFCGATKFPYSVGYHSIIGVEQIRKELKLEFLLHDSPEAYLHDLTAPLKGLLREFYKEDWENIYDTKTTEIFNLIGEKFDLRGDGISFGYYHEEVNIIDKRMGVTEIGQLLSKFDRDRWMPEYQQYEPFIINILELNWRNVEELFLQAYKKYRRI